MTIPSRRGMPAGRCRQPAWPPRRLLALGHDPRSRAGLAGGPPRP